MIIKNYLNLARTKERAIALKIINSALESIKTEKVIQENVFLKNDVLFVKGKKISLKKYKRIFVVGFGKASSLMAKGIESVLGKRIVDGFVIDVVKKRLKKIKTLKGTHPLPSKVNLNAAKKIIKLVSKLDKDDLVLCLVSGGGSALFSNPFVSLKKYYELTEKLVKSGADIDEINTVRKHISRVKGGNFAKIVYPAKLVSLVFSDVVGDNLSVIASGPCVMDKTTVKDAERIRKKYSLGKLSFRETPKDKKYFGENILLLTNKMAVNAMAGKAGDLGLSSKIYSTNLKGEARFAGKKLIKRVKNKRKFCLIAAGETTVNVKGKGKGGRNQELCLGAIGLISKLKNCCFVSINSDGTDSSNAAGAVVDFNSLKKAKKLNLDYKKYLKNNNSYNFFKKMDDLAITGKTGTNVSDLVIVVKL